MLWAGKLWGKSASVLALFLYAFDPTITAHAQLVTTDVGLAFFATLFLFILRGYLQAPSPKRLIFSGVALGLALGAKFSAVILVPIAVLISLLAAWSGSCRPEDLRPSVDHTSTRFSAESWGSSSQIKRLLAAVLAISLMIVIAIVVLWAIYLLPADPFMYLKGLKAVNQDHDPSFRYYLMGELRPRGWHTYFLIAWLIKTPIPSLLLFLFSIALFVTGRRAVWMDELFLVVPALAFFVGYSLTADDIGIRYLIPCFPFLMIFAARTVSGVVTAKPTLRLALAFLLSWYLVSFL
jgi:dolichyl-phosphate-mannose-protein mannosyltransferase